jgi:hypothetical protein
MRGRRSVLAVLALVGLLAGACSEDDAATEPTEQADSGGEEANDGAVDTSADGGSSDGSQSNAEVPGISVPLPPGADAVTTTESGPLTVVQFIVPLDQREATVAFYDDWTESQPDAYQRVEAEAGGVSWQDAPEIGAERTIIALLAPLEGDDFVTVTLTVGPAE